jgi:Zn-finger nucleic acid-binding protein
MRKFRLICPDCSAAIITSSPRSLVWELCPSCWKHVWDGCDALMADVVPQNLHNQHKAANPIIHPDN